MNATGPPSTFLDDGLVPAMQQQAITQIQFDQVIYWLMASPEYNGLILK